MCVCVLCWHLLVQQVPELRKQSRWTYLDRRRIDKLEELKDDIADDEYLFADERLGLIGSQRKHFSFMYM